LVGEPRLFIEHFRLNTPGWKEAARDSDAAPVVRYAHLYRDGFGRFTGAYRNTYIWRPDFDEFMEWYERHLADLAYRIMAGCACGSMDCAAGRELAK
jgi:hypothetical protein